MMSKFIYRDCSDSDGPQLYPFVREHFGQSHLDTPRFNQYWFKNSESRQWNAKLALDQEGRLRGVMMAITVQAKLGDQILPMAWISSAAVDDEARKQGAGAPFYFWVYKSFPVVGGFSGNEFSTPINDAMAARVPGGMDRFVAVLDRAKTLELCRSEDHAVITGWLERNDPKSRRQVGEWVWSEKLPADFQQLWKSVRSHFDFTVERTDVYMKWRYQDVPYLRYHFLEIREGGILTGLAVVRFQSTPQGKVARVVDFISEPARMGERLNRVAEACSREGCIFADFFCAHHGLDRLVGESVFVSAIDHPELAKIPHLLSPVEHRQWSNTFHAGGTAIQKKIFLERFPRHFFVKGDSDRDWATQYDLKTSGVSLDEK